MVGDSHLHVHVVSSLCAFPRWTCQLGGPSRDMHSWDMPSRDVAAWSARSEGCESSSTSSDPAERADKRYSVMARTFRTTAVGPDEARSLVPHVQITASRRLLGHDKMLPVVSFAVLSGVCDCEGTS